MKHSQIMNCSILLIICSIVSPSFAQYYYNNDIIEPTISTVYPPPIKSISHGYVYPKPEIPFTLPKDRYRYSKPKQQLALPNQKPTSLNLYIPPTKFPKDVSIAPKLNPTNTLQRNRGYEYPTPSIPLKKEGGYQYPKPLIPFPVPKPLPTSTEAAKFITRVTKLNPTTTTPKSNRGYEYATPSTTLKKEGGYQYPKPLIPFPVPKPLLTSTKVPKFVTGVTKLYQTITTPKPIPAFEYSTPSISLKKEGGYKYPIPIIPFPVPKALPTSTESPEAVTKVTKLNPTTTTPKLIQKQSGYQYPKPLIPFPVPKPLPTTTKAPKIVTITPKLYPTTTLKPIRGYKYPIPSTPFKMESGYQYPKPIIPFPVLKPLPTSTEAPKAVTRVTKFNPTITTPKLIQKQSGYQYPKPLITFPVPKPLPTTTKAPKIVTITPKLYPTTTTPKPDRGYKYPIPSTPFKKESGYQYPKPIIPFPVPKPIPTTTKAPNIFTITTKLNSKTTTPKPNLGYEYPTPVVPSKKQSGYQYPKPLIPFPFPLPTPLPLTTIVPKTLKPITTLQPTIPTSKGYVYPIPRNPLIIPTKAPQLKIVTTTTGFEYAKPSIAFNILKTTTKTPTSLTGYYYPQPIIPFEPGRINEIPQGYKYPKPSVQFES